MLRTSRPAAVALPARDARRRRRRRSLRRADGPTSWRTPASRRASGSRRRLTADALYVNVSDAALDRLRAGPSGSGRRRRSTPPSRVLRHEFDLLGSGPYTPDDPDRPADATRLPADRLVSRSGLRAALSARRSARRVEFRADAARPRRHQAAVGAGAVPALAAARPGLPADAATIASRSRSRASCATSWRPTRSARRSTGPARWTSRCARRTGRSASS